MSRLTKEELDLVTRTKKIVGATGRRGAISGLMAELMELHIRHHTPRKTRTAEEAAEDLVEIVRSFLK
jgi:hypothetical protein